MSNWESDHVTLTQNQVSSSKEIIGYVDMLCNKGTYTRREGIITYEHISHPTKFQIRPLIGLWPIHPTWLKLNKLKVFNSHCGVKSTNKITLGIHIVSGLLRLMNERYTHMQWSPSRFEVRDVCVNSFMLDEKVPIKINYPTRLRACSFQIN